MGNRGGAFHRRDRTLGVRRWATRQWICCRLDFNDRHRAIMQPGRYTELFFLDEATAMAAGHRPCGECRRQDFLWFAGLWAQTNGTAGRAMAEDMDLVLHAERAGEGQVKRTYHAAIESLPGGAFVRWQGEPHLVLAGWLLPWDFAGYGAPIERPSRRHRRSADAALHGRRTFGRILPLTPSDGARRRLSSISGNFAANTPGEAP